MRRALVPLIASIVLLANASAVSAKEWCVAPATGCADGNVGTLGSALTLAKNNAGPDQIRLGGTTYNGPFTYDDNGTDTNTVAISGAGRSGAFPEYNTTLTRT